MKQAVLLVLVFLCCLSFKEGSSEESCPDAKNSIDNDKVKYFCWSESEDPCYFNIKFSLHMDIEFIIALPEDVRTVYYEVLLSGDGINATASGKAYVDKSIDSVEVYAEMKGDLPVGHKGTATVSLYYNDQTFKIQFGGIKDIPDWCSRTNIIIVYEDEME